MLAPFIAGALIILFNATLAKRIDKVVGKTICMSMSIAAVAFGFIMSLAIFDALRQGAAPYVTNIDWFVSDSFKMTVGVLVDNLASMMMIVVTTISLLVQIYTHGYMREDPGYNRFYAYLSLFTGSMLGLVISTNLFQMFIFWELVGVCSYFLIGFWWFKPTAAFACMKAFVVNRIGDFGFLVGILLFFLATYGFWHANPTYGILNFYDPTGSGVDLSGAIRWAMSPENNALTVASLTVCAFLIFWGPMAKSAQVPLHVWLPDAMEGPTPISALIHAATMVAAGIYMVARAYPIWLNWTDLANPTAEGSVSLAIVAFIGGITAFMAATIALTQFDIKRALAWSTVSQLGYMFVGLGCGAYSAGMFHLTTHAFFKAMLFLGSGAVIHACHGEQDMRQMGGLMSKCKFTAWTFLVGCFAISGLPFSSGFFSKDEIIGASLNWTNPGDWALGWIPGWALGWLMVLTAGMTAFYMFRMFFMTFSGQYRGTAHVHEEHAPDAMTWPLIVLAVPSALFGFFAANGSPVGTNNAFLTNLGPALTGGTQTPTVGPFAQFVHFGAHAHPETINTIGMFASIAMFVAGAGLAMAYYQGKGYELDKKCAQMLGGLYRFSLNKWYWDELYGAVTNFLLKIYNNIWLFVDKLVIDSALIDSIARDGTLLSSGVLKMTETGRGQAYALAIFAGVAVLGLFVYFYLIPAG